MVESIGSCESDLGHENRRRRLYKAVVVASKGADAYAVTQLEDFVKSLGVRKVIIKSDQEPAILSLKTKLQELGDIDVLLEESPVHESKTNGEVENVVRQIQGQTRILRSPWESRYGILLERSSN